MGEYATHLRQTLGARNAVTGQPAVTWVPVGDAGDFACGDFDPLDFDVAGCIKIMVKTLSSREMEPTAGRVTDNRLRFYTVADIRHRDRVIYHSVTYEVETEPIEHYHLTGERYRDATCIEVS